jgi:3,4-dihydroxy 2-butanone 4-phosphate synthase / GTP cyclohydrolase II
MLPDDPWKYYELYTPRPIQDISTKNLLVRIDSGCDIGQIYNDNGCDCREQLHSTLRELQHVNDGVIIHIPGQDGRGFGAATKMETEGLKRGIRVITNQRDLRPMDTVAAAQQLLGRDFDIRTYEGAGKILNELGVDSIRLNTDNRLKVQGMSENGITVRRQATGTTGANGSLGHVQAKHQHADIYFGEHE